MPSKEDSTESFRNKVTDIAEKTVMTAMEIHKKSNEDLHARTQKTMEGLAIAQEQMKTSVFGAIPPDAANPGMWNILQSLVGWRAGVNKVLWVACTASIGALVAIAWKIISTSGTP